MPCFCVILKMTFRVCPFVIGALRWLCVCAHTLNSSRKSLLSSAIRRFISSSSLSTERGGYFLLVLGERANSGTVWSSVRRCKEKRRKEWVGNMDWKKRNITYVKDKNFLTTLFFVNILRMTCNLSFIQVVLGTTSRGQHSTIQGIKLSCDTLKM